MTLPQLLTVSYEREDSKRPVVTLHTFLSNLFSEHGYFFCDLF